MKALVISSQHNIKFARNLFDGVQNSVPFFIPLISDNLQNNSIFIEDAIADADIVFIIIDKHFQRSQLQYVGLQMALNEMHKKNKRIISIALNNAEIPNALENYLFIQCNTTSQSDLDRTREMINMAMNSKKDADNVQMRNTNRNKMMPMIVITIAIEAFAMLFVLTFFYGYKHDAFLLDGNAGIGLLAGFITVFISIFSLLSTYLSIMKTRRKDAERDELNVYSNRLKRVVVSEDDVQTASNHSTENPMKKVDAIERMLINLEDIKAFYTWSQKQAKSSHFLALFMCIAGLLLMVVAILLPTVFKMDIGISIFALIGSVFTDFVGGTALIVYRKSLLQLNHYHKALHEDERFLSSVTLIEKFSTPEAQDDMLRELIRSEIQMNISAMNTVNDSHHKKISVRNNLPNKEVIDKT